MNDTWGRNFILQALIMAKPLHIKEWEKHWNLTVIKELEKYHYKSWTMRVVLCSCVCGNKKSFLYNHIKRWITKSCWCITYPWPNLRHWMTWQKIHRSRTSMRDRCNNVNNKRYKNYWGRWITYDPKRKTFEWFYEDMWASYVEKLTLERIDNNWNYCKENCKWIPLWKQSRNRRGVKLYNWKTISEIALENNINAWTLKARIERWWSLYDAITKDIWKNYSGRLDKNMKWNYHILLNKFKNEHKGSD